MSTKKTAPFASHWVWIFGVVALVCYFADYKKLGLVLVILTAVGTINTAMSHFIRAVADERDRPANTLREPEPESEEFTLGYPAPGEHGWHPDLAGEPGFFE